MNIKSIILLFIITLLSCTNTSEAITETTYEVINNYSYNELITLIGEEKLYMSTEQPNSEGALGRNKNGYFHVRFQINMTSLSDYALVSERVDALQNFTQTLEYSFQHQLEDGSFQFNPPEDLLNSSDYQEPVEGDLESGTAFFASSLGISLLSLQHSTWYQNNNQIETYRSKITQQFVQIEKMLDYLLSKKEILKQYDAQAPNRLLFDALAYYTLGKYLERTDAEAAGIEFMELALELIDSEGKYFIEGGGWDSSYNGVAIKLAMELFSFMETGETKNKLANGFIGASLWQISRINEKGKVSTEGNTRVFPGGESFLGAEKGVDYTKIIRALYYFGHLTAKPKILQIGDSVLEYYN